MGLPMSDTLTVECPHCGERFVIVQPEPQPDEQVSTTTAERPASESEGSRPQITAELVDWDEVEPNDPYSGNDDDIPVTQRVIADVRINGTVRQLTYWYTPAYGYFSHVVRGQLTGGVKSKNAYPTEEGLAFTNRGNPRHSNKEWAYLDEDTCRWRSSEAGLGEVRGDPDNPDRDNRFLINLDEADRPLVGENGDANEELLLTLARGLVAFKT